MIYNINDPHTIFCYDLVYYMILNYTIMRIIIPNRINIFNNPLKVSPLNNGYLNQIAHKMLIIELLHKSCIIARAYQGHIKITSKFIIHKRMCAYWYSFNCIKI